MLNSELPFAARIYATKTLEEFESHLRHPIHCSCDEPKPCSHPTEFRSVKLYENDLEKRARLRAGFESDECHAYRIEALRPENLRADSLEFLAIEDLLEWAARIPATNDSDAITKILFSEGPIKDARVELGKRLAKAWSASKNSVRSRYNEHEPSSVAAEQKAGTLKPIEDLFKLIKNSAVHQRRGEMLDSELKARNLGGSKAGRVLLTTRELIEKNEDLPDAGKVDRSLNSLYGKEEVRRELVKLGLAIRTR